MTLTQTSETVALETHPNLSDELYADIDASRPDRTITTIRETSTQELLATLSQQKISATCGTRVHFLKAKGGFFAIVHTEKLTYMVLPGSQLQLPDTRLNLPGDLPPGRLNPGSCTGKTTKIQTVTDQAMILGAGLASRFIPVSGEMTGYAKPSVPLIGEDSVIVTLAKHLQRHGIRRILVNTFYMPDVLKAQLNGIRDLELIYIDEDKPSGTAGGLLKALEAGLVNLDKPILIMQGDAVTDADLSTLLESHQEKNALATIGVKHIADEEVSQMAIVVTDQSGADHESGFVTSFREKPTLAEAGPSRLASIGFYILSPQAFAAFQEIGKANWASHDEFDYAFHFFPTLLTRQSQAIYARLIPQPFYWSDIGRPDQYIATVRDIYAGKLQTPLPPDQQRYFDQGIIYWADAREKAAQEGALLTGNIIVSERKI